MSRSYKKYPCYKQSNKGMKRFANKRVRHKKDIPNGKAYKKVFCTWDICDWRYCNQWRDYWKNIVSEWKRRYDSSRWWFTNDDPHNFIGVYYYWNKPIDHWSKQDPELHKDKYYALWKKEYLGK